MIGVSNAAHDVLSERRRQIEHEGFTPERDDKYDRGSLAKAAACYAYAASVPDARRTQILKRKVRSAMGLAVLYELWPWSWKWWKPTSRRADLVKAGALIIAEIERIDRERVRDQ